ncbi:MAG: PBP1A family penicillin-binding protein [Bacillota bacterium]
MGLAFVLFGAAYIFRLDAWSSFDPDKILKSDQTLIVYDKDAKEYTTLSGVEDRIWVSLADIPDIVEKAFISAEDARFYDHIGVDFVRILGAAWNDIKEGSYVQGASTISQQLAKLSHLTAEKQIQRKLEEAVLAYQMEQQFTKDQILEMYLNYVYFGGGYYGVEAAARGYFGVHASDLTVAQGAMLAGILKGPSHYAPHIDLDASIARRNLVLSLMQKYGYLSEGECQKASAETVNIVHGKVEKKRGYYVDLALSSACKTLNISMDQLLTGGYRIYTAMDSDLQQYCESLFEQENAFPAKDVEGAIVVVDSRTAGVAALVGGRESKVANGFNRAVAIKRQPGSIIKPILVYAPALESFGYTAASMLLDEETSFGSYKPNNFGEDYNGWVTLREAVTRSLNVPAVKVFSSMGVESGKLFAERLGIRFDESDDGLALALGGFTYGVSPYQIAGAYACFAAGGIYKEPSVITRITDAAGNTLYEQKDKGQRVMSAENAYILTSMLESVVEEGTGHRLGELSIPLAGKTGTVGVSAGNRDAWMAAYNPEYAAAVWMGYDTSTGGKALDKSVTGGTYPALMLKSIFERLYMEREAPDFAMPEGVEEVRLDRYMLENEHKAALVSALTPADSVVVEVFKKGTAPTEQSGYWMVPTPPTDLSVVPYFDGKAYITFTPENAYAIYRLYRETQDGVSKMVEEFTGSLDQVSYHDSEAEYGIEYAYYVVPYHPTLRIDGRQVVGAASQKVRFLAEQMLQLQ